MHQVIGVGAEVHRPYLVHTGAGFVQFAMITSARRQANNFFLRQCLGCEGRRRDFPALVAYQLASPRGDHRTPRRLLGCLVDLSTLSTNLSIYQSSQPSAGRQRLPLLLLLCPCLGGSGCRSLRLATRNAVSLKAGIRGSAEYFCAHPARQGTAVLLCCYLVMNSLLLL